MQRPIPCLEGGRRGTAWTICSGRATGVDAAVGFDPSWRVDSACRFDPNAAGCAAGRAVGWAVGDVGWPMAGSIEDAPTAGACLEKCLGSNAVGAKPLRSRCVAGSSALATRWAVARFLPVAVRRGVDIVCLRDRLRKRRLRPGTEGGRMALTAWGAGTGRTGRKARRAFNREDKPPGAGWFRWRESAGPDAPAVCG